LAKLRDSFRKVNAGTGGLALCVRRFQLHAQARWEVRLAEPKRFLEETARLGSEAASAFGRRNCSLKRGRTIPCGLDAGLDALLFQRELGLCFELVGCSSRDLRVASAVRPERYAHTDNECLGIALAELRSFSRHPHREFRIGPRLRTRKLRLSASQLCA
jgi:hypothetical protein